MHKFLFQLRERKKHPVAPRSLIADRILTQLTWLDADVFSVFCSSHLLILYKAKTELLKQRISSHQFYLSIYINLKPVVICWNFLVKTKRNNIVSEVVTSDVYSIGEQNLNIMCSFVKGRLLRGRGRHFDRKTTCDETKWLLISGHNSEVLVEKTHSSSSLRRTSSTGNTTFQGINRSGEKDLCKLTDSCTQCTYAKIINQMSESVRPCLPSPTLMRRRRNAICDEIEKKIIALPGRTLRQGRVDMLRGIALMQFSLL